MKVVIDISKDELDALWKIEDLLNDYAWEDGWNCYSDRFKEIEPSVKIANKICEAVNNTFEAEQKVSNALHSLRQSFV